MLYNLKVWENVDQLVADLFTTSVDNNNDENTLNRFQSFIKI